MRIVFYGNGTSGNHGCEAIIRGSVKLIGDEEYILLSEDPDMDKRYGLSSITEIQKATNPIRKDLNFIKAFLKLRLKNDFVEMDGLEYIGQIQRLKSKVDLALSVGGDNYCYGYTQKYTYLNKQYQRNKIKTVLWGCSIEPDIVNSIQDDLRKYNLIVSREQITYNALRKIGANVCLAPDPAFFMEKKRISFPFENCNKEIIGINISPLILDRENTDGIGLKSYKCLIDNILENTDAYVLIIPHVVLPSSDDRIASQSLVEFYKENPRVNILKDCSAPEIKYVISKCSFFIGARTHSTIAAYSSGVPTLVVGYSVKARGIALDLFGTTEDYVLSIQNIKEENELCNAFLRLYSKKDEIRQHLYKTLPGYLEKANSVKTMLEQLVQ